MDRDALRSTYDAVAEDYAERFLHELDSKPADRRLLDHLAAGWGRGGRVLEVGCGPGQLTRYLHDRGIDASGLDLSPVMVATATRLHPGVDFEVGDMAALPCGDGALVGIVAFYCLIHIPRPDVPAVMDEWARALAVGGTVAIAVQEGEGEVHADRFLNHEVQISACLFTADELVGLLEGAGLVLRSATTRDPYPTEGATRRVYVTATKIIG